MKFFEKLQNLDRRWIYMIIALAIIIPLMIPYNSDNVTTPQSENLYQMIDSYAGREDRAVLISILHDPSTMPELFPMEVALIRHCFERNIKVFLLSWLPQGAPIIDYAINTVKEEFPDITAGVDYCNFGYRIQPSATVIGMGDNIARTIVTDAEGRKLENLPIMKNITNYNEMNLVVEFSGSTAGGTWIALARPKFGLNVAVGVTAVMAADLFPYLQSGQLIGMLTGLKGAAEYEKLVDVYAAYRNPEIDYNTPDAEGKYPLKGRAFSRDILKDESVQKMIKITKQTKAEFTPEEFALFVQKYPAQKEIFESLKQEDGSGKVYIEIQNREKMLDDLGLTAFNELERLTYDIKYKFKVARIGMNAQSIAHVTIFVFILIGNIGYFVLRAKNK
ncbi:MAG: hypothetical protein PHI68_02320 [Candidatus Cloacimonetes bacterium]|nr:hypothetical protein [Candidatus Cloacimonadota bacterium]